MNFPNILMIVADQLRYDCVGYAKKYPVKTPNLDILASEGMSFHNAYTTIPICCPSRQTLLNGRRSESFGALWNYDITFKVSALEPDQYTWTKELQDNGYNTSYIGKWHVNPTHSPLDYGFDYYYSEMDYKEHLNENYPEVDFKLDWFGGTDPINLENSRTHVLSKVAMDKLEEYSKDKKPWHIRLDFFEPHLPCNPCKQFNNMYDPKDILEWGGFRESFKNKPYIQKQNVLSWGLENMDWNDWSSVVSRYYAIITQMDDAIGRVLEMLKQLGQENNTLVIFTSDHGDMCGSHRMIDKHCVMYDDIVRVPLIIKWKGTVKENSVSDSFVYNTLDIPPTLIEACNFGGTHTFHGRSLLNMLKGKDELDWRKEVVSTYNGQQFGLYCQRMIRNENFKYIWNLTDVDELYDLTNDPYELTNIIKDQSYKDVLTKLRVKLYECLKEDGDDILKTAFINDQLLKNRKI